MAVQTSQVWINKIVGFRLVTIILNFTGLHDRLSREMLEMRPFQTPHKIYTAKDPNCDAWYGAREFANASDLPQFMITKQDYDENGGEYFKEHKASNLFCATPDPTVMEVIE